MVAPGLGEGDTGLPGSKSVARAEGGTRNRGGPKHSGRSNCESQAGTTTQRQGVSSGDSGVGSAHNRSLQGQSPEATEGADMSMPPAQGTSTVITTEKDWQTFLRALAEKADGNGGLASRDRERAKRGWIFCDLGPARGRMRERIDMKSSVREYRPPGSVRGAPGNRRPYLDNPRAGLVLVGARRSTKRFPRGGARARLLLLCQLYGPLGVAVAGWRLKPQNVTCWFFIQFDLASWGNSPGLWSQTSSVEVNSWL